MNLYEKIEKLYRESEKKAEGEGEKESPAKSSCEEIMEELKEIKEILLKNYKKTKNLDISMRKFVSEFRERLKPDVENDHYPEVEYNGRRLGVNFKGLLYDKETLRLLSTSEAFEVYRHFYREHLEKINKS